MDRPLISVIVPIYNAEKTLERCIKSIIRQSYSNIEVILVDDGSTDNSLDLCKKYMEEDERIKVIHQRNQGVGAARNRGLSNTSGEYVTFVDSDDFINKDAYSVMLEQMLGKADVCIGYFSRFHEEDNYIEELEFSIELGLYDTRLLEKELYKNCDLNKEILIESLCNKIFRKEIFNTLTIKGNYGEDCAVMDRIYSKGYRALIIDKICYYYTYTKGSLTKKGFNRDKLSFLKIYSNRSRLFEDMLIQTNARKQYCALVVEYYYEIEKINLRYTKKALYIFNENVRWLMKYNRKDKKFLMRMCIFAISPNLYRFVLKTIAIRNYR